MEQQRFDDLSRGFATGLTRRRIVGLLLGAAGGRAAEAAAAECPQGGVACRSGGQCCTGRCLETKTGGKVCSCTKTGKSRCKQPDNPCKKATCPNGRCVTKVVECGGACTNKCLDGQGCALDADCTSGWCRPDKDLCATPACDDGFQNGGETGLDCGGPCPACPTTKPCTSSAECTPDGPKIWCNYVARVCETTPACDTNADCDHGLCCGGLCKECPAGQACFEGALQPDCCELKPFCTACAEALDKGEAKAPDGCGGEHQCLQEGGDPVCPLSIGKGMGREVCCSGTGDGPGDGACCGANDACFVESQEPYPEFCCVARGVAEGKSYHVCNSVCCNGPCDSATRECIGQSGRLGSYRRGPIG
jgi:hypothetical protein